LKNVIDDFQALDGRRGRPDGADGGLNETATNHPLLKRQSMSIEEK
jgi:hypothetical protein